MVMSEPWVQKVGIGSFIVASMLVGGVVTALVAGDGGGTGAPAVVSATAATEGTVQNSGDAAAASLPDLIADVRRSVVVVTASGGGNATSGGTGSVIDRDGHILTNFHVIEGMSNLKVTLADGTAAVATVVGTDPGSDLAVLKVDLPSHLLIPVRMADSDRVRVGDAVFAIGHPFGQNFTVTSGIISATGRVTESAFTGRGIRDVLQVDAAVNPGNSGGPLFTTAGEMVGVNTSIENPNGRFFVGLGFAVPSNTVLRFLPAMIAGETIEHPQLGVSVQALDDVNAATFGVSTSRGLYVLQVTAGSAAERAGVLPGSTGSGQGGDVILAINGEAMESFEALARAIDRAEVGDVMSLRVRRGAEEMTLEATLQPWDLR
ncbi:MAG: 2-alkenal reductase [Chloroflexi bacterium HGW-Chloroflexi-9]|nr:MAG: 2-alkenal reductase [Chloroflexi bacterium HGW-Chloroflexi-9]